MKSILGEMVGRLRGRTWPAVVMSWCVVLGVWLGPGSEAQAAGFTAAGLLTCSATPPAYDAPVTVTCTGNLRPGAARRAVIDLPATSTGNAVLVSPSSAVLTQTRRRVILTLRPDSASRRRMQTFSISGLTFPLGRSRISAFVEDDGLRLASGTTVLTLTTPAPSSRVVTSPQTGSWQVPQPVLAAYDGAGGQEGPLGPPTAAVIGTANGWHQEFLGGRIDIGMDGRATVRRGANFWREAALHTLDDFDAAEAGSGSNTMGYALATRASARLLGWDAPRTQGYLAALQARRLPSGSWGINEEWDAFADGSVNAATTAYTISITAHVGLTLLDGWRHGAVSRADIDALTRETLKMNRAPARADETCLAYSTSTFDRSYCVNNIQAGAVLYLTYVTDAGLDLPGTGDLVRRIERLTARSYRSTTGFWPYLVGGRVDQDWNHNALNAEQAWATPGNPIGAASVTRMLAGTAPSPLNAIGQLCLLHLVPSASSKIKPLLPQMLTAAKTYRSAAFNEAQLGRARAGLHAQVAVWAASASQVAW